MSCNGLSVQPTATCHCKQASSAVCASSVLLRVPQLVEEDAESMAAEDGLDSHPLLARPSAFAIVAPALPARVFLRTQVGVLLRC